MHSSTGLLVWSSLLPTERELCNLLSLVCSRGPALLRNECCWKKTRRTVDEISSPALGGRDPTYPWLSPLMPGKNETNCRENKTKHNGWPRVPWVFFPGTLAFLGSPKTGRQHYNFPWNQGKHGVCVTMGMWIPSTKKQKSICLPFGFCVEQGTNSKT